MSDALPNASNSLWNCVLFRSCVRYVESCKANLAKYSRLQPGNDIILSLAILNAYYEKKGSRENLNDVRFFDFQSSFYCAQPAPIRIIEQCFINGKESSRGGESNPVFLNWIIYREWMSIKLVYLQLTSLQICISRFPTLLSPTAKIMENCSNQASQVCKLFKLFISQVTSSIVLRLFSGILRCLNGWDSSSQLKCRIINRSKTMQIFHFKISETWKIEKSWEKIALVENENCQSAGVWDLIMH